MSAVPITLLTGFLGSGKTTLPKHWLSAPQLADTVVIINEFGEVSIDHLIVTNLAESIVELRNGCLCCSIRGDLALTLHDLLYRRQRGDLPPFARIVTVVDVLNFAATVAAHETAGDQIALADLRVLSKTDLADAVTVDAARGLLARLNPAAEIVSGSATGIPAGHLIDDEVVDRARRAARVADWTARHAGHDHDWAAHDRHYRSHACRHPGALSLAGTTVFLNRVVNELGPRMLRVKGIAGFREKGDRPGILHAVQNKFYPLEWLDAWPDDNHDSRMVFIGRDFDPAAIEERFQALCV